LFTTGYKRHTEGRHEAFGFWPFGCGRIAGGRLLKGENECLKGGLLKGKDLLKESS
jgi:hypothetical protein